MASTARQSGMPGAQSSEVLATQKEMAVRITASSSKHDHVRIRGRETAIAVVFMAICSGL